MIDAQKGISIEHRKINENGSHGNHSTKSKQRRENAE